MSTTSLRKIEIKFISVLSLCTLFWAATPDAFAISGKNKSVKSVVKTANKSAPKSAGRTSQAPTLNTLLNGLGAPNATDGIDATAFGSKSTSVVNDTYVNSNTEPDVIWNIIMLKGKAMKVEMMESEDHTSVTTNTTVVSLGTSTVTINSTIVSTSTGKMEFTQE